MAGTESEQESQLAAIEILSTTHSASRQLTHFPTSSIIHTVIGTRLRRPRMFLKEVGTTQTYRRLWRELADGGLPEGRSVWVTPSSPHDCPELSLLSVDYLDHTRSTTSDRQLLTSSSTARSLHTLSLNRF
ncbi:hypothetical protein J6590_057928 [Homalodisca vitripennis]|nr:hypothetical protein J6590_057928 [Homalodisca vitripennis]